MKNQHFEEAQAVKYTVLLQKDKTGYTATVPVLPGCKTKGTTEKETLEKIRVQIARTLSRTRAVTVEVDPPDSRALPHPWEFLAGIWRDDPSFADFLAEIEADRCSADAADEAA